MDPFVLLLGMVVGFALAFMARALYFAVNAWVELYAELLLRLIRVLLLHFHRTRKRNVPL